MRQWRWVELSTVYAAHDRTIAEHGGLAGIRDSGAIESAMARPQHLATYGSPDAADLAAAYAFGLARNHGFSDGNKRVAWIAARIFLLDNGELFAAHPDSAIDAMQSLAAGDLSQEAFAAWIREQIRSGGRRL